MAENSKIEWTDHTFNPWIGCAKVAAGCEHCYAEAFAKRYGKAQWGPHGTRVKTSEAYWRKPLKWERDALHGCRRDRVFCASLADVFEDWDGAIVDAEGVVLADEVDDPDWIVMTDLRRKLFVLIDGTPHLDWLLLTKRPENIQRMWPWFGRASDGAPFRKNVWLGTSISTQADADRQVPELLKCRDLAPVLFLSVEPLVEAINLIPHVLCKDCYTSLPGVTYDRLPDPCDGSCPKINWVIVGGESGPGARPCNVSWIRSIVEQCKAAGVPCFVKQLGSDVPFRDFKHSKGGDPAEWPEDLRVRQFPEVAHAG